MINREHPLPLTRQGRILNISRSGIYYALVTVSDKDRDLMRLMDEIHLEYPFMGSRGIKNELWNKGHKVGRTHIRTLMRKMGIEAIYKKPRLSEPHPDHTIYPEPPRYCRRLQSVRGWSHEKSKQVFSGSQRAGGSDGVRAWA